MPTIKEVVTHATAAGLGASFSLEVLSPHSLIFSLVSGAALGAVCVGIGNIVISGTYKTWFSSKKKTVTAVTQTPADAPIVTTDAASSPAADTPVSKS